MHLDGPALVLAGPGCGKTFVITHRVAYLIKEKCVPPGQIAIFTFTKASAMEMRNRCISICKEASLASFGTFHSIFYQILCSDKHYSRFTVLSSAEKNQILKQILFTKYSDIQKINQMLPELDQAVSYYLNTNSMPENVGCLPDFAYCFNNYQKECIRNHKLDFDMILSECLRLLKENERLLSKWQTCFRYLLVDEFQDTNEIQLQILKLLAEKTHNLYVVGDDDQSIYRFRGADPSVMQCFLALYPNTKRLPLFENFRCKKPILELSQSFIRNNRKRFDKQLTASVQGKGEVRFLPAHDQTEEIGRIRDLVREKLDHTDGKIAILCRTAHSLKCFKQQYMSGRSDRTNIQEDRMLWRQETVKDIVSYVRFAHEGNRRKDLLPVLNKPQRYLSSMFFEDDVVDFDRIQQRYRRAWEWEKKEDGNGTYKGDVLLHALKKLYSDMNYLKELDSYGCICYILHVIGYEEYSLMGKTKYECEETGMIFRELKSFAKTYPDVKDFLGQIDVMQTAQKKQPVHSGNERIHLMTYHAAKGLEFEHVFLPFVNEHIVPHKKAKTMEELEEERRMFYVAMTRAKDTLTISYVSNPQTNPSLFIREIRDSKQGFTAQ